MFKILSVVVVITIMIFVKGFNRQKNERLDLDQQYLQGEWTYGADGLTEGARLILAGQMSISSDQFTDQLILKAIEGEEVVIKATITSTGTIQVSGSQILHHMQDLEVTKLWSKDESLSPEILKKTLLAHGEGSSLITSFTKDSFITQDNQSGIEFKYQRLAQ